VASLMLHCCEVLRALTAGVETCWYPLRKNTFTGTLSMGQKDNGNPQYSNWTVLFDKQKLLLECFQMFHHIALSTSLLCSATPSTTVVSLIDHHDLMIACK
jgi:hypothetical protein